MIKKPFLSFLVINNHLKTADHDGDLDLEFHGAPKAFGQ